MSNNIALITGGSSNIGSETAKLLAKNGYTVIINYLNNKCVAENISKQITLNGGNAVAIKADISNELEVISLFNTIDKNFGPITALVNNAVTNPINGNGLVEEMSYSVLKQVFETNVFGVFFTCREAILRMKKNNYGSIVNISSEASKFGGTRVSAYSASKGAINSLTVAIAKEVAGYGIRVNAVSPGKIEKKTADPLNCERLKKHIGNDIPIGRMGYPIEVAECIQWLLSDKASYITGSIISVNGGR